MAQQKTVKQDSVVQVHYTGKYSDGKIFDTSEGDAPLDVTMGQGKVIKGFEDNLLGMAEGEEKTFTIAPENAYGPYHNELVMAYPKNILPPDSNPQEGAFVTLKDETGNQFRAQITKVTPESVTIDLNHPLAGKELTFKIKVVTVK